MSEYIKNLKIELHADRVFVSGPKGTDQSYSIKFDIGEYERDRVADLLRIPPETIIKVTIETAE